MKTPNIEKEVNIPKEEVKKKYKVIAGVLVDNHCSYHVGMTIELTEARAKQIGKQIELVK